ncbi:DNA-methyltransferase [Sphingobacterium multivorum]|uniref:DNA-methyltransferase n=1 Tax=Sphingobacterium multivorum TaxID=28454 RepID=UPI003DA26EE5
MQINDKITIYHGDCLEILPMLSKKGIKASAVIADIPYGTTQCSWDVVIPFDKMWEAIKSVTDETTPIVLFGAEPFSSMVRMSNIQEYKYDIIWDKIKGTGFLNAKKQPMRNHENIMVFYKKQCTYNPQMTKGHKRKQSFRGKHHQTDVYGDMNNYYRYDSTERYPRSIQEFSSDTQNSSLHPTQKPVSLMEYLIRTYTDKDDLVIDFTQGSGTTGIACYNTGREYIGIEKDKLIFDISKKRLTEHTNKLQLFTA